MGDWDKSWFGNEYSYKYPCNYCNGHNLDIECPIYHICGCQYIHWNGCPKSYSLPPNPYYDSSVICDVGRGRQSGECKTRGASCEFIYGMYGHVG
ncbi:hypothetical protein R3W88_004251 [Solanum pinnatisectum]|uniref:Uncharacterized protein n=1 Tax=Solanum pinnatisectum TaxID=50273 RepID=A0AAV9KA27_9SOLN|nr:hypothetical protein R3W88_004251 [Solanum pinnatisectum]